MLLEGATNYAASLAFPGTYTVHEQTAALTAGVDGTLQAELTVPRDAAPSFAAGDNTLSWVVELSAGSDWREIYAIEVRPARRADDGEPYR